MRHKKLSRKFHRTEEERKRLWQDLSTGLIKNGQIVTFTVRATWFRTKFERMITHVKRAGDDKQLAFKRMTKHFKEDVARLMVEKIAPQFNERNGGYTQQFKLDKNFSDKDMSVIRLTQ
jgi:large subunit ribosomal protein L17